MNSLKITLCLIAILLIPLYTVIAQEDRYPPEEEILEANSGDLILREGIFKSGENEYSADYGTLVIPENRTQNDSRLINIPVVRIHSTNDNPAEPVFLLTGGPGQSNIWKSPKEWLLKHHDIVMVGYRGFDGSVFLKTPEIVSYLTVKSDPLSGENLKNIGQALNRAFERFRREGIDPDGYNMVEVIDDIEAARKKLGYDSINLLSASYGTRIAYIYGLRYPDSINRSVMYAVNPPGHFVWEPDDMEFLLAQYNELWKKDSKAVKKSPDLLKTIKTVFNSLPAEWNGVHIDSDKVKIIMFTQLYHVNSAVMVFDAFVAAGKGDYSGLAYLSAAYDMMVPNVWNQNWGEPFTKSGSADYHPDRDYETEMMPEEAIFGSPMSKLTWGAMQYCKYQIKPIPEEYRTLRNSDVATLMINGNMDFSTPVTNAKKLLPYLKNGKLVILREMGHTNDVAYLQPAAFQHMVETYYLTSEVDDSKFKYQPIQFTPSRTFQDMAKERLSAENESKCNHNTIKPVNHNNRQNTKNKIQSVTGEKMISLRDHLIESMKTIFGDDQKRISHALSVLAYAEGLQKIEGGDQDVVIAAAVLHDIGIPEAERKYNSSAGKYQEIEGPPIARKIMAKLGLDKKLIDHVCRIVGSHHTGRDIDTLEFRILWDSDWLVNFPNDSQDTGAEKLKSMIERIFKTDSGKKKALELFIR
ncbi:alpha/beta fold hydrolase [Candidatus Latescibacterota bacterium]